MQDKPPTLDYARPAVRRSGAPWQTFLALPPLLVSPMTMCMCGHMDFVSLLFTLPAGVLASWGFARREDRAEVWQILTGFVLIVSAGMLAKNLADILWFGHDALLGG